MRQSIPCSGLRRNVTAANSVTFGGANRFGCELILPESCKFAFWPRIGTGLSLIIALMQVAPSRPSFQSSSSLLAIPIGVQRHVHLAQRPQRRFSQSPGRLVCNATESTAPGEYELSTCGCSEADLKAGVKNVVLAAAVIQEAGTEDLSGEDKEQWQDGLQQLRGLGMPDDEAEKSLKRGFGWSSQAYWWKDKVKEVPKPGEVCKTVVLCWHCVSKQRT